METEVDPRLVDNSFEAKAGSRGAWGERANRDLKFTKGNSTILAHCTVTKDRKWVAGFKLHIDSDGKLGLKCICPCKFLL